MEKETLDEKLAELEALLFIHGEPMPLKKIGGMLALEADEVQELIEAFKEKLAAADRGLGLVVDHEKVQLVTKARYAGILESFVKDQLTQDLTPATLETLSIITYIGPVSRSRIEYLRGVNSTFTLRSLLIRGLVERVPAPDRSGSYVYQPSFELLKHLGVQEQKELPDYEKFKDLFERPQEQIGQDIAQTQ